MILKFIYIIIYIYPLGTAALKPETNITLFNDEMMIEIYYQKLRLNNSLSRMMVV